MKRNCIILDKSRDNVAVALTDLRPGDSAEGVLVKEQIGRFHKVALTDINSGSPVYKYGEVIGITTSKIEAGTWIHNHNLRMHDVALDDFRHKDIDPADSPAPIKNRYFLGFKHTEPERGFGTRNYLLIASTVDCSARTVELAVEELNRKKEHYSKRFPNVDGIIGLTHNSGCGVVALSPAHLRENKTVENLINHPNVGGRVVVQLGCEKSQASVIFGEEKLVPLDLESNIEPGQIPLITIQEGGGTWDTVDKITEFVEKRLLPEANRRRRELIPASELKLALQCGGSNSASGVSANPAIGYAADLLVRQGGSPFISETTETAGAEHLLALRACTSELAEKFLNFAKEYARYLERGGGTAQNNLGHGNMAGGLTTIAEKSLGAVAKGGSTPLCWVNDYAERITGKGFGFMNGPAYDPPSATGQTAGGAQVGVFSTGAGSCYGGILIPWIKVVSNTPVFDRLDDMEINAGRIIDGTATIEEMGTHIFESVLAAASGAKTYSEKLGYSVVNIWNSGVIT
ncbi:MAG: altronate dehydratase [Spirochaetales bacterium]|jgi:altronate hydrolase|nr:altronate dehydratase [Spirochaetales bacterium]